ncbi:alkanesulfonate monooxygenase SsuD/methylene tetrahydromethanopterin reductase-like flavin-dependent oxidoreductase (luciferase family) [Bradyrhizobium sp. F1.13.1]
MRNVLPTNLTCGIFDHLDDNGRDIAQQYADRLALAEAYDRLGFYAYHVAEHHCSPHGRGPSPNLFLSSVIQRTRRLRVGPLVMLLNLYHPLRAFEEICMLDHLSSGRVEVGLGRGSLPIELSYFGVGSRRCLKPLRGSFSNLR